MTQVTLGNFYTLNGKNVLNSAGGTGLDEQSLIQSLVAAKSQPATNDQTQITANGKISDALNQFQTLLSTFQSAADALSNPPGVNNAVNNVFDFTTGSVGNGGSAYLSVTTQPGAALQSYAISDISNLATAANQSTGTFTVASADASVVPPASGSVFFNAGTVTVGGQPIQINTGDSLNAIAAKFNAVSGQTGITAAVIQISSGSYQMSFTATQTGAANSFDLNNATDPSGVLSNLGLGTQATQSTPAYTIAFPDDTIVSANPIAGTANQFAPGTLDFGNGNTITLTEGETLDQVVQAFNDVSGQTGIAASVYANSGNYGINFTAVQGGASHDFDLNTVTGGSTVFANAGLLAATDGSSNETAGTDAAFKLNGIPITRSSNNINDVINGVTFNLLQTTPDSTTTYPVTVQPDTTTVQNSIVSFVSAYNAIKSFAATQTQLNSDGTYASTAILANNMTFRNIMADLTQEVTAQVGGIASGEPNTLADAGITFTTQPASSSSPEVDNILNVNDGQLSSMLSTNFQGIANLFGFNLTSDNPNLTVFSHTNSLSATSFTINADPTNNIFTASIDGGTPITLQATALPGNSGYTLTGPAGSALDGLELIYASTSAATINVTATQGLADQLYNTSDAATVANTGTLAVALTSIQDDDTRLNNDITQVNAQVTQYQQQLLQQFAALEQAVSQVNTLLDGLTANQDAALVAAGQSQ